MNKCYANTDSDLKDSLVPGRDRTAMNTVKTKQMKWVSTAEAVLV